MVEKNISQKFRLKNLDETRNYFFEETKQNELMSKKHEKFCTTLNYIEHFLILASAITGCILNFAFTSLIGIPIAIMSSAVGVCPKTAGNKKYKPIVKKKKKKHDKTVLLAKAKFNNIEVLISKALIDSVICHDEFGLINYVLKEYENVKEEIKNSNNK